MKTIDNKGLGVLVASVLLIATSAWAQAQETASADLEPVQDDVSKALDSTATQWSFQFAYQETDWKDDTVNGDVRPAGLDNFAQLRVVAPLTFDDVTILPRLTIRHYENANTGDSGLGNSELFGLIIPKSWDWGSGRMGIGPLVTTPGDEKVARDEWGYGVAGAWVNTAGDWFYGVLLTQSWRGIDPQTLPPTDTNTNPLGIAPFLNYQLGNGWYLGNGDMVINYDWKTSEWYVPINVRFGRVTVGEKGSWNMYAEIGTSLIYDDWEGAAKDTSIRLNITRTIPVGAF